MWRPYAHGTTVGQRGTEEAVIVRDEQHDGGARITRERDCLRWRANCRHWRMGDARRRKSLESPIRLRAGTRRRIARASPP